jgi:dolichol-phosphate mannosyltransferase
VAKALLVVPTYNERENVEDIAGRLLTTLRDADILFVDDNSPDGTGELLDEMSAREPRIHVLHRAGKLGLGTAYIAGFRWALSRDYGFIFEFDADGSHDPKYLPHMLVLAEGDADVVVGSRNVPGGGTVNWGVGRKLLSRGGSFYARTILGIDVHDVTAGYICWRRRVLESLDLDGIKSNGYSFQIEMKYRAIQQGFKLVETPIVFIDRRAGQSKMSRKIVAEALMEVWKLRLGR